MRPEWRAHLDELMEHYQAKRRELTDLQERLRAVESTVTTDDEMITVRVGAQGQITGLEFNPRLYRAYPSTTELADAILAAARRAGDEVRARVREESGVGEVDLSKYLPERPDDFESVKQFYGFRDR